LLDQHVLLACAGENGLYLNLIGVLEVVTPHRLKEQRLSTNRVKQEIRI